jgi:hypothetical protein
MLILNQRAGFSVRKPRFSCVLTDSDASSATSNTYLFPGKNTGPPSPHRWVVVMIMALNATSNRTFGTVTIGGITAIPLQGVQNGTAGIINAGCYAARVPEGETADINITWSGAQLRCAIGVYRVTDLHNFTATDFAATSGTTASAALTIDVPAYGAVLAIAYANASAAFTWGGGLVSAFSAPNVPSTAMWAGALMVNATSAPITNQACTVSWTASPSNRMGFAVALR